MIPPKFRVTFLSHQPENKSGMTLVEVVISLVILAGLTVVLAKSLIWIQYSAEYAAYDVTAQGVARSVLEQMKGATVEALNNSKANSVFYAVIDPNENSPRALDLGDVNAIAVPIVSDSDKPQSLSIELTPNIEFYAGGRGYWISVEYQFDHPQGNRTINKAIGCVRSKVPTF